VYPILVSAQTTLEITPCKAPPLISRSRQDEGREYHRTNPFKFNCFSIGLLLLFACGLSLALSGCESVSIAKSFTLQSTAATPTLSISANNLTFGNVVVSAAVTQSVTLESTGTKPVTISAVTVKGKTFTVSGATFPLTLSPNQTATLDIEFVPTATGQATGQLTITSNSSVNSSAVVSLSGTGIAPSSFANISIGTTPGIAIAPTFMGLSHEWGTAQAMMGDSTTGVNNTYRQLLQNLTAYGSGPIHLRIGGDSSDKTGEPNSTTVQPFAELANALGVRFSLGVNLGADDVNLAVDQATDYVAQMPAGSLDAIEIGNEPDTYGSNGMRPAPYTFQEYLNDFNTWKDNIMPLLPTGTKLMGASWASTGSLSHIQPYDSAETTALADFSQHYYVANGEATNPDDILLMPSSATAGPEAVAASVATTHQFGVPYRMGEMNSLYNGGENGISNAFESALWAIDNMFGYANVGVDGVNWHTGYYCCGYDAFAFDIKDSGANTTYTLTSVNPLYYGLLFFQAATGNGAHLLPVTLNTKANLTAWATVDASNTPRLVLINKDENSTGTVDITLSGYSHAQIYRLTAPSYLSTSGVTFAGQTFDGSKDGVIQGTQTTESVDVSDGVFQIPMPITGAALVVFAK
jgi:Glycosyl hydrolase family 79 C-terminal beta domain/Abnormal spindle-like microcephaly-assoc'd, ASPM-SPD-2-Hydin